MKKDVHCHVFTSESVSEGHPDKVADQISDAILDACLAKDRRAHVACETLVAPDLVVHALRDVGALPMQRAHVGERLPGEPLVCAVIADPLHDAARNRPRIDVLETAAGDLAGVDIASSRLCSQESSSFVLAISQTKKVRTFRSPCLHT